LFWRFALNLPHDFKRFTARDAATALGGNIPARLAVDKTEEFFIEHGGIRLR
jgi:hypothetical protein